MLFSWRPHQFTSYQQRPRAPFSRRARQHLSFLVFLMAVLRGVRWCLLGLYFQ